MPNTIPINDSVETTRWMQSAEAKPERARFPIAAATRGSMGEALTGVRLPQGRGAVAVTMMASRSWGESDHAPGAGRRQRVPGCR